MTLVYVAELPIPLLCPSMMLALGGPSIQFGADLTGNLALHASLSVSPPTAAVYLAAEIASQFQVALALPTVAFDASVSAGLEASFSLSLSLLPSLSLLLSAGVHVYALTYEGTGVAFGSAVTSELATMWPDGAPSSGPCQAIILGAASAPAMSALESYLDGPAWAPGITGATLASLDLMTGSVTRALAQASLAISAKLAAQVQVTAAVTGRVVPTQPQILASLILAQANMRAQLSLKPPSVSAAISASAKLAASISASAGFMAQLGAILSGGGELFAYTYSGSGTGMGSELTAALASTWPGGTIPTSGPCAAIVLAATDPVSWAALTSFFGGV